MDLLTKNASKYDLLKVCENFIKTRLLTNTILSDTNKYGRTELETYAYVGWINSFCKETVYLLLDMGYSKDSLVKEVESEMNRCIDLITYEPEFDNGDVSLQRYNGYFSTNNREANLKRDINNDNNLISLYHTITSVSVLSEKYYFTKLPYPTLDYYRSSMKKLDDLIEYYSIKLNIEPANLLPDRLSIMLGVNTMDSKTTPPIYFSEIFKIDYNSEQHKKWSDISSNTLMYDFLKQLEILSNNFIKHVMENGEFIFGDLYDRMYKKSLKKSIDYLYAYRCNSANYEQDPYRFMTDTININYKLAADIYEYTSFSSYENNEVIKTMIKYFKLIDNSITVNKFIDEYINYSVKDILTGIAIIYDPTNIKVIGDLIYSNILPFISGLIKIFNILKNKDKYKRKILDKIYDAFKKYKVDYENIDLKIDNLSNCFNSTLNLNSFFKYCKDVEPAKFKKGMNYFTTLYSLDNADYQFLLEPLNKFLVSIINSANSAKNTSLLSYLFNTGNRYAKMRFDPRGYMERLYMMSIKYDFSEYKTSIRSKLLERMI